MLQSGSEEKAKLTAWNTAVIGKHLVVQLVKIFSEFL
jgi:hypothetical protein